MTQDEIDARRYRWLRQSYRFGEEVPYVMSGTEHPEVDTPLDGDDLDAAIDAAMAEEDCFTITPKGRAIMEGK